ncbi:hypothetical protein EHS25_001108 [Saitozyma podzolica]|uniref:Formamidase n=1 Tax=Saitozyma podzolica TaxID=1890683 RepID=A0A427YHK8_9TREE|nr:hypothetical protein EHS25_001108 [Saitozyma podzolica]
MPTAIRPKDLKAAQDAVPTLVRVNPYLPGYTQKDIHTRWHPDIPCVADVPLGQAFRVECLDYSGGQVVNDDCADDILDLDHDSDHHLSGPFFVPGAQPGDVLEIDVLEIRPFDSQPWGYCVTAPGLGSLDHPDVETRITKSIWDFRGCETSSRHVPHVSFHGRPHPGVIGTAPSPELLAQWTEREADVARRGAKGVCQPVVNGAYVGQDLEPGLRDRIYREGARTSPGREHGGNIDIGALTNGAKIYLPVYVPGAKLSVGDLHFCEADGEPTTAIEMAGIATLRVNLIPGGISSLSLRTPMYQTSPADLRYNDQLVFTGLSVDLDGTQTESGGLVAYRNAAFSAIDYLMEFGYTREQAYILLSVAPVETKVVATANRPNFVISLGIPLAIFDFDIRPSALCGGRRRREITGPAV